VIRMHTLANLSANTHTLDSAPSHNRHECVEKRRHNNAADDAAWEVAHRLFQLVRG
jgi:hypothetical protein